MKGGLKFDALLGGVGRRARALLASFVAGPDGRSASDAVEHTSADGPIRKCLDMVGLPWREPRRELIRLYGVAPHPAYGWDVIEIATTPPLVDGLLWPVSAQAFAGFSTEAPAIRFTGVTSFGTDPRENLRRTARDLERRLGRTAITPRNNTMQAEWRSGASALRLTIWPEDLQRGHLHNPAHRREPRLITGCHLTIETGFRFAPTAEETAWLRSFEALAFIRGDRRVTAEQLRASQPAESEVEFVREPGAELDLVFGRLGTSRDGRALIFCLDQLYLVPIEQVLGVKVERILPAKGGGGSYLTVICRADSPLGPDKNLVAARAETPDGLNTLGEALAARLGKPFELGEPTYDV